MNLGSLLLLVSTVACVAARADEPNLEVTVQRASHVCAAGHNPSQARTKAAIPTIAGQMPQYLAAQLKDFRSQTRAETDVQAYMWGISALLDDSIIDGLAEYFASQSPEPPSPFVSVTVSVAPPDTLAALIVRTGGGEMVNATGDEVPPPGNGENTVTCAVPTVARSAAVIAA